MSKAIKAALFSAFVIPGCGHFIVKRKVRGLALIALAFICVYFILSGVMTMAYDISDKIQTGQLAIDVAKISNEVAKQRDEQSSSTIQLAIFALFAVWVFGVVDSFRLGRAIDKSGNS